MPELPNDIDYALQSKEDVAIADANGAADAMANIIVQYLLRQPLTKREAIAIVLIYAGTRSVWYVICELIRDYYAVMAMSNQ